MFVPKFNKKIKVNLPKVHFSRIERHFSLNQLIIFVLVFAALGTYFLWNSLAATPIVATVQAESMTLPAGTNVITDSSASGGQAVQFTQNGIASSTVSLSSDAASFSFVARGNKCKGGTPKLTIGLDGTAISTQSINSSGWQTYSISKNLLAGSHNLTATYSNSRSCGNYLYLDVVTFYGAAPVSTPVPTIAFSASPSSVSAGSSSTLTWSSTNASSCTASGAWSGSQPTSGSVNTGALNASSTYNLNCTGAGGTAQASTAVSVTGSLVTTGSSIYWGATMNGKDTYGTAYGDAPWDSNTWNKFETDAGKKVSVIKYHQDNPWVSNGFFDTTVGDKVRSRGVIPVVDMTSGSTTLSSITSGTYDAQIKTWANNVTNWGKPFMLRYDWEMNGNWYSYNQQATASPSAFVAMWRHFHDVVAGQGATNVTWVWCPNTEWSTSEPSYSALYPGDSYVDWTCLDGYNKNSTSQSFASVFQKSYNDILAVAPTKPIMIGEVSSLEYGSGVKASWITDMLSTQLPTNFPKVKAVVWFNWLWNSQPYQIESSASAQSAFQAAIASPYYVTNNYGNLPLLTKVKPLP